MTSFKNQKSVNASGGGMKNLLQHFVVSIFAVALALFSLSFYQSPSSEEVVDSLFPDAFAGFNTTTELPYGDYLNWPSAYGFKASDTIYQSFNWLYDNSQQKTSLTDFNGDGLVDLLYHLYAGNTYVALVLVNNGNLGYDMVYKCVRGTNSTAPWHTYYGDCADV